LSASPYEVLGVPASVSDEELRKAFRKALRETHPDTGGDPERFVAVQLAWERIGTREARTAFDAGHGSLDEPKVNFEARTSAAHSASRPKARAFGHPGGWRREKYLGQLREWVGRGVEIDDPYDPVLVRSAPREIRHTLADALAEEATARSLSALGIGYTVWHDVATASATLDGAEEKIDHIVLGPSGLFAMLSEDFGGPVRSRKGELIGEAVGDERPVHELVARSKQLARRLRVRFTGLIIVLPDDALATPLVDLGSARGAAVLAVRQEHVAALLRAGLPGLEPIGGNELFDVRTRLTSGVRFV
jgi:hypothetical protein